MNREGVAALADIAQETVEGVPVQIRDHVASLLFGLRSVFPFRAGHFSVGCSITSHDRSSEGGAMGIFHLIAALSNEEHSERRPL